MAVAGSAQFEMVMSRQAMNCLRECLPRLLGDAQKLLLLRCAVDRLRDHL